jgi:hypothetical protein
MDEKNFVITGIKGIKFYNKDGSELVDIRDKEPVERKMELNIPIIDLILHHTVVPLEWCNEELFCKYGYAYFGIADGWRWYEEELKTAPEIDLWKMYGLCNEYWHIFYDYLHSKKEKEFRDYRRSKGEDLNSFEVSNFNIDDYDTKPMKLRIYGDRNEGSKDDTN